MSRSEDDAAELAWRFANQDVTRAGAIDEVVAAVEEAESKCRSGCPTPGLHQSWGECARSANFSTLVGDVVDANRRLETNLAEYRKVRKQGIQPKSIRRTAVEASKIASGA